ncbi:ABC transporter transmembrane domain-containing protein [Rhizomicrobium electricum]|uniref:ABC transporter ATP-binding protein/permease n=1 Tax=Rhizomicrobium electricum TaxID=480070 RepID=A0ABN1EVD3_9PROT|nr:ABC transporter transmembrane domain-containing protein [Rhizomicrobium electricum]NIJ49536.1 ATP-binding cassette subfamily B protein [Rhizomicrobium electricum]
MAESGAEYAEQVQYVAQGRAKGRSLKPLKTLVPFLKPYRGAIAAAALAMVVAAGATLVMPAMLRGLVDRGFSASQIKEISHYFFLFLAAAGVMGFAGATRFYFVTWIGERVVADIRKAVYAHVLDLTPAFFEITRTGEVLSRLSADTTLVQTVIGSSASFAIRNVLMAVAGIALMFFTSWKLTGLVVAGVLVVILPLILFGRWVRKLSRLSQDKLADTSAHASETLNAVATVQAFTREGDERKRYGTAVEDAFVVAILRTRARAVMTAVATFAVFGCIVGVGWVGAQSVLDGTMTPGQLVQFIIYAILVGGAFAAVSELWGDLQRAAGASERLVELLTVPPAIVAPLHPKVLPSPARGVVHFENVEFRYPLRPDTAALNGFSLHVEPGEAVALVGPSGAGKSTVFQLLLRFYAAQQGRIAFDGLDIADLDPHDLRRAIAMVAQDPVIFSGTIADNIRYGRPEASEADVRAAADAAAALEFVEKLPDGFATRLGERGVSLSGGQRQRLAIARAMLRNAPLLLLDEATSALDAENERLVQQGLANLMEGRTTLVIAHRLATIQRLKRIVVMDQGKVADAGSHDDLVAKGGLYARLASLQFSGAGAQKEDVIPG